jgi:ADP-ribose pyrophosphatase YjhB (NUDIX family)
MDTKVLVIGVVKKENAVLLRKKPDGSPPYTQTWYLFGGELTADITPEQAIQTALKQQAGINIRLVESFSWDTEVKADHDGQTKLFVYLDAVCEYVSGELVAGSGIERLEWVDIDRLHEYDHVPPSQTVFRKLGYL